MKACAVVGCRNKRNKEKGISLHRFPRKEEQRNLWIYALGRHNYVPTDSSYICSEHFQINDFGRPIHFAVRLKEGAIPSIFPATPEYSKKPEKEDDSLPIEFDSMKDGDNNFNLFVTDGLDNLDDLNGKEEDNLKMNPSNDKLQMDLKQQIKIEDALTIDIGENELKEEDDYQYLEADVLKCSICNFTTKIKSALIKHFFVHNNLESYSCDDDSRSIINAVHEKLRTFKCNKCTYTCNKKSDLTNHEIQLHGHVRPFQCLQCDYAYNDSVGLSKHVLAIHQKIKPYICPQCAYGFTQKTHLSEHILIVHQKIKKYLCENCDYASGKKNNLVMHILRHHSKDHHAQDSSAKRPFKCMHCECTYTEKTGLSRHIIAKHVKIKPFKCCICSFTFSQKSHLRSHILTVHQKIKKFQCPNCKYAAGKRNDLIRHNFKYH